MSEQVFEKIILGYVAIAGCVFLAFAYWQRKLVLRIHEVSRTQHQTPENVFWLRRARMAIEADSRCQVLVKKRNRWGLAFVAVLLSLVPAMAIGVFWVKSL